MVATPVRNFNCSLGPYIRCWSTNFCFDYISIWKLKRFLIISAAFAKSPRFESQISKSELRNGASRFSGASATPNRRARWVNTLKWRCVLMLRLSPWFECDCGIIQGCSLCKYFLCSVDGGSVVRGVRRSTWYPRRLYAYTSCSIYMSFQWRTSLGPWCHRRVVDCRCEDVIKVDGELRGKIGIKW